MLNFPKKMLFVLKTTELLTKKIQKKITIMVWFSSCIKKHKKNNLFGLKLNKNGVHAWLLVSTHYIFHINGALACKMGNLIETPQLKASRCAVNCQMTEWEKTASAQQGEGDELWRITGNKEPSERQSRSGFPGFNISFSCTHVWTSSSAAVSECRLDATFAPRPPGARRRNRRSDRWGWAGFNGTEHKPQIAWKPTQQLSRLAQLIVFISVCCTSCRFPPLPPPTPTLIITYNVQQDKLYDNLPLLDTVG